LHGVNSVSWIPPSYFTGEKSERICHRGDALPPFFPLTRVQGTNFSTSDNISQYRARPLQAVDLLTAGHCVEVTK